MKFKIFLKNFDNENLCPIFKNILKLVFFIDFKAYFY